MAQQSLRDTAMDVIREALRKGDVLQAEAILQTVPDMINSVKISQARLGTLLERIMEDKNPLNSLLGLLGFRLVNTRKLSGKSSAVLEANGQSLDRILTIDRPGLELSVERLVGLLAEQERSRSEESSTLREKYNGISRELDTARRETEQLTQEYDAAIRAIAERVQYLLSLSGAQETESSIVKQLTELLSDVELEALWPGEGADGRQFTVIKTEIPENHKVKPCIRSGEQVIVKGVYFIRPEGATVES